MLRPGRTLRLAGLVPRRASASEVLKQLIDLVQL
jgi:hypothetical protein